MKLFKRFWFDRETGEFNWAMVAILLLAAIFFYNVITANVQVPGMSEKAGEEAYQQKGFKQDGSGMQNTVVYE